jgi:hypothetical protein
LDSVSLANEKEGGFGKNEFKAPNRLFYYGEWIPCHPFLFMQTIELKQRAGVGRGLLMTPARNIMLKMKALSVACRGGRGWEGVIWHIKKIKEVQKNAKIEIFFINKKIPVPTPAYRCASHENVLLGWVCVGRGFVATPARPLPFSTTTELMDRKPPIDSFHYAGTHGDGRHRR